MGQVERRGKEAGILFPRLPSADVGAVRGSTYGNKGAWAAAIGAVDRAEAEKILKEKNWRANYRCHVLKHVRESAKSRAKALKIAEAGLAYCYDNFEFARDGKITTLGQAMASYTDNVLKTGFIKGTGKKPTRDAFSVPYKGKNLAGEDLLCQLDVWAEYGTIEPSARDAIAAVVKHPAWLDLSDMYFCLLGAASAMGPFMTLMALGANVIAIDLDRTHIWKRLIDVARSSPGTLTFPMKRDQGNLDDAEISEVAGCNLFTDTPEIRNWLLELYPGKTIIVGAYAYLDGELHVKVSLAMDAVIRDMTVKRKAGAAYLCTPTDVHLIPREARESAIANKATFGISTFLEPFLRANVLPPVRDEPSGEELYLVDGIVGRQGPNYILAKRIQHWRAIVAREETKVVVSSNIAPSSSTVSVTHNKLFAMVYGGLHHFKPMEVSTPEMSNAVMAALLIHDIRNKDSVAHPDGHVRLVNPLQLMSFGSFHGGVWRAAFPMESLGIPAAILFLVTRTPVLLILSVFTGVLLGNFTRMKKGGA